MDITVLKTLEYYKIRTMLADRSSCAMGRELAEELVPTSELVEVERRIAETKEARDT